MDIATLYDFCLDWQMKRVDRLELISTFRERGWNYLDFKRKAEKNGWFVPSMVAICYILDV